MCINCGDYNYLQRLNFCDLKNKYAIVTGARIKIGFEIVLKLLRAGCTVIATTRFPKNAVLKYSQCHDFHTWKHRLHCLALDFLHLQKVFHFLFFSFVLQSNRVFISVFCLKCSLCVKKPIQMQRRQKQT